MASNFCWQKALLQDFAQAFSEARDRGVKKGTNGQRGGGLPFDTEIRLREMVREKKTLARGWKGRKEKTRSTASILENFDEKLWVRKKRNGGGEDAMVQLFPLNSGPGLGETQDYLGIAEKRLTHPER